MNLRTYALVSRTNPLLASGEAARIMRDIGYDPYNSHDDLLYWTQYVLSRGDV